MESVGLRLGADGEQAVIEMLPCCVRPSVLAGVVSGGLSGYRMQAQKILMLADGVLWQPCVSR